MEIWGGILINYLASLILAGMFFIHVADKAMECGQAMKQFGGVCTIRFNRSFGFVAWVACVLPGYSTMPVAWWWYYLTPISVLVIIGADIWLTKLESEPAYYRHILQIFGVVYGVCLLVSTVCLYWRL
jgi:hypothetical protein